jgi:hypothetical protein
MLSLGNGCLNFCSIAYTTLILNTDYRSPLSKVDSLLAATLIFVGANDQKVLPETQGIALHRDLSSRFVPTALYHYPGKQKNVIICSEFSRE